MNAQFREGGKSCGRVVWEGFEVGSDPVKPFASVRKSRPSLFCVHSYYCRWRASVPPPF
jgi:hypothetical protein